MQVPTTWEPPFPIATAPSPPDSGWLEGLVDLGTAELRRRLGLDVPAAAPAPPPPPPPPPPSPMMAGTSLGPLLVLGGIAAVIALRRR